MAGIEDIYADIAKEVQMENQVRGPDLSSDKETWKVRLRESNPDAVYAQRRKFRDTE